MLQSGVLPFMFPDETIIFQQVAMFHTHEASILYNKVGLNGAYFYEKNVVLTFVVFHFSLYLCNLYG